MLELNPDHAQISTALADHMKVAFGSSWKESLCEKELDEKIDPGQPAVLVISLSALRSCDFLRLVSFDEWELILSLSSSACIT